MRPRLARYGSRKVPLVEGNSVTVGIRGMRRSGCDVAGALVVSRQRPICFFGPFSPTGRRGRFGLLVLCPGGFRYSFTTSQGTESRGWSTKDCQERNSGEEPGVVWKRCEVMEIQQKTERGKGNGWSYYKGMGLMS